MGAFGDCVHYAWLRMSGGYGAGEADQEKDGGGYNKQGVKRR